MRLAVFILLLPAGFVAAQSPPVQIISTPIAPAKVAAPKVVIVKPNGAKAAAPTDVRFEQRTEWVTSDVKVGDYLARNGLAVDANTVKAFRTLNPQVHQDGTIPAGSRVSTFAPTLAGSQQANATGQKAAVDMSQVAKFSVSRQVADARQVRVQTVGLPTGVYQRQSDATLHRRLVTDVDRTAALVQQRADKLSARDLALSKYYLNAANINAATIAASAKLDSGVSSASISQLQGTVAPVQQMQMRMASGEPPFDSREITVNVASKPGESTPPPLRVYMLPGGCIDTPKLCEEPLLTQLLVNLTFDGLTTPSRSRVEHADMRVWIGPEYKYAEMAKLISAGTPFRFKPVHPAGVTDVLTFTSPDDVVQP